MNEVGDRSDGHVVWREFPMDKSVLTIERINKMRLINWNRLW
jgi:hypothetical protein